jgi:carotenoid cleavage dioxygenase-like enzyme
MLLPCRFHDFAITKNYAVFMHMPLVFDPSIMVKVRRDATTRVAFTIVV